MAATKTAPPPDTASTRRRQSSGAKNTATATHPPVNVSAVNAAFVLEKPESPFCRKCKFHRVEQQIMSVKRHGCDLICIQRRQWNQQINHPRPAGVCKAGRRHPARHEAHAVVFCQGGEGDEQTGHGQPPKSSCSIPSTHKTAAQTQNASISTSHMTVRLETRNTGVNNVASAASIGCWQK